MFFLSFLSQAAAVLFNPQVSEPKNTTYYAGQTVPIRWNKAQTGQVNIDVVNIFHDVMGQPITIASGVPAEKGVYNWQVPAMLKSAVGYKVRVWGSYQPGMSDANGLSETFTVINNIPNAVNSFIVLSPNEKSPCKLGQPCEIKWDYPANYNPPADVHVALYKVGQTEPLMKLATVPAAQKSFIWNVPEDASLLKSGQVYIAVDGGAKAGPVPKMASPLGSNSASFNLAPQDPQYKAQQLAEAKKKQEEAEKKKQEELKKKQEEAEKAKKEAEEKAKKEAEEKAKANPKKPAGRINQQKKANNAAAIKAGEAALVAAVMAALLL